MSVTITVSKAFLTNFPEVNYQLFNMSSHEEEKEWVSVFTAKGYYRELTDLLDLYQIPYKIYSSLNLSLLHVLIFEEDGLALDLKQQLESWGFGFVEVAHGYQDIRQRNTKNIALALLDDQTIRLLSLWVQVQLLIQLLAIPLILLATHVVNRHFSFWRLIHTSSILYKPFSAAKLREVIERRLHIALPFASRH